MRLPRQRRTALRGNQLARVLAAGSAEDLTIGQLRAAAEAVFHCRITSLQVYRALKVLEV